MRTMTLGSEVSSYARAAVNDSSRTALFLSALRREPVFEAALSAPGGDISSDASGGVLGIEGVGAGQVSPDFRFWDFRGFT